MLNKSQSQYKREQKETKYSALHQNITNGHFCWRTLQQSQGIFLSLSAREGTQSERERRRYFQIPLQLRDLSYTTIVLVLICRQVYRKLLLLQPSFGRKVFPTYFFEPSWSQLYFTLKPGPSLYLYLLFGLYFYQISKLGSVSQPANQPTPVNFVSLMLMIIIFVWKSAFY